LEYDVYTIDIWRTDILDAIMEVDGNCNVKQANKDACTLFGYPAAGLKTLNLSRLFHLAGNAHTGAVASTATARLAPTPHELLCFLH